MTQVTVELSDKMIVTLLQECIDTQEQEIERVEALSEGQNFKRYRLEDRDDALAVKTAAERLLRYYGVGGVDW